MKVRTKNRFREKTNFSIVHEVGSEFECTEERGKYLIELGFVEKVKEPKAEKVKEPKVDEKPTDEPTAPAEQPNGNGETPNVGNTEGTEPKDTEPKGTEQKDTEPKDTEPKAQKEGKSKRAKPFIDESEENAEGK